MTWFLFTTEDARNGTLRCLWAALRDSTFCRMKATTCSRLRRAVGAAVGHVPATAHGLLLGGVPASSTHRVNIPKFSGFGLENRQPLNAPPCCASSQS